LKCPFIIWKLTQSFNKFEKFFCPISNLILFFDIEPSWKVDFQTNLSIAPNFLKVVLLMYKNKECGRLKSS